MHALRHFFASALLDDGESIKAIAGSPDPDAAPVVPGLSAATGSARAPD